MKEYVKDIYSIEETQNIEGSYIGVKTLFVNKDKTKASDTCKKLASKKTNSFGLMLSEYKIKTERSYFYQSLERWSKLPIGFYRKARIISYQPLTEIHA